MLSLVLSRIGLHLHVQSESRAKFLFENRNGCFFCVLLFFVDYTSCYIGDLLCGYHRAIIILDREKL